MRAKVILGRLVTGFILVVLVTGLYFIISARVLGQAPSVFGYEIFTVLSGSMEPSIKTGSIIIVKPQSPQVNYRVGDVVTYRPRNNPDILVTHRIVKINSVNQYVTKGDSNNTEDLYPIASSDILGRYTGMHISYAGYLFNFVKTKNGIVMFLVIPWIILIVPQIIISVLKTARAGKKLKGKIKACNK